MFFKLNFKNTSKANLLTILIKSNSKNCWMMNHAHMRQIRIVNPKFWMIGVLQPQGMDWSSRYQLGLEGSFSLHLKFEYFCQQKNSWGHGSQNAKHLV